MASDILSVVGDGHIFISPRSFLRSYRWEDLFKSLPVGWSGTLVMAGVFIEAGVLVRVFLVAVVEQLYF